MSHKVQNLCEKNINETQSYNFWTQEIQVNLSFLVESLLVLFSIQLKIYILNKKSVVYIIIIIDTQLLT